MGFLVRLFINLVLKSMCGLATHYIPSEKIDELLVSLYMMETEEQINNTLNVYSEEGNCGVDYQNLSLDQTSEVSPVSSKVSSIL
jgi:hypothetical protein